MSLFATVEEAFKDLAAGKMLIVVDDENRENEGDFVMAAEKATPERVNFMVKNGSGVLCAPMVEEVAQRLQLPPMVPQNTDPFSTNFTVSVDLLEGTSTGISAMDRAKTFQALARKDSKPEEFSRPGHVFPLKALSGGVMVRRGHTEATTDLLRMAGLSPVGMLCEITNEDGSMARLPQLEQLADKHGMRIVSIQDIFEYRVSRETLVEKTASSSLSTEFGEFELHVYKNSFDGAEHLALVKGDRQQLQQSPVLARIHSECFTGDVLGSRRCDCGEQLFAALEKISEKGSGVLIYLRQEGRGIGLSNKLKAYNLQDEGYDTATANKLLGFPIDMRDYAVAAQIFRHMGITSVNLLTNNPEKISGLKKYGVSHVERTEIEIEPNATNRNYLTAKKKFLGHILRYVS